MRRLIDADKLLECFTSGALLFQPEIRRIINEQPTVDAEQVVYCKDCMHNCINRFGTANAICNLGIELYQLNDYCSEGVPNRRND